MGNSAPSQNATVEEILASIRQAISEDDAKRTLERHRIEPRSQSDRRPIVSVTGVFGTKEPEPRETPAPAIAEDSPAVTEPDLDHGVIEHAIEKALDGVRAELDGTRPQPSRLRPRVMEAGGSASRTIPRAARGLSLRREVTSPARALLSPRVDAQVSASFDDLAKAMIEGNSLKLDEVVEALLRPMLKTWLDGNLPQIVERLVREEIERVSRGRR